MALFPPGGGEGSGGGGPTPKTPEILNSLMSMTNPFDNHHPTAATATGGGQHSLKGHHHNSDHHLHQVPPLHHTRSQLIKEGLKLTLQTKRKTASVSSPPPPSFHYAPLTPNSGDMLTPEDEERRRRRRERNKIAATKCRLKKREKTFNLVHESEILENQNMDLKSQIQDLENEKRRLVDMLTIHRPNCSKGFPVTLPENFSDTTLSTGYVKEQYTKVEISCETRICWDNVKEDPPRCSDQQKWHRPGEGYTHQGGYDYVYPGSGTDYPRQQQQGRPQTPTCDVYNGRTPTLSTSSSDFDSVKDIDSPTLNHVSYNHFDDQQSDSYITMFPLSTTVTHS